jgi:hypothetical protein
MTLDRDLIEAMSAAHYEVGRPRGSSYPPWPEVEETHRALCRRQMEAAVKAGEGMGLRVESLATGGRP